MDLVIECPDCSAPASIDSARAEDKVRCARCGERFVPGSAASAKPSPSKGRSEGAEKPAGEMAKLIGGGLLSLISLVVIFVSLSGKPNQTSASESGDVNIVSTDSQSDTVTTPTDDSESGDAVLLNPPGVNSETPVTSETSGHTDSGVGSETTDSGGLSDVPNPTWAAMEPALYYPDGLVRLSLVRWAQLFQPVQQPNFGPGSFGGIGASGFGSSPESRPVGSTAGDGSATANVNRMVRPLAPDDVRQIPILDRFLPKLRTTQASRFALREFTVGYYEDEPVAVFRLQEPAAEEDILHVTNCQPGPDSENRKRHEELQYNLAWEGPQGNGIVGTHAVFMPDPTTVICGPEAAMHNVISHLLATWPPVAAESPVAEPPRDPESVDRSPTLSSADTRTNALLTDALEVSPTTAIVDARLNLSKQNPDSGELSATLQTAFEEADAFAVSYQFSLIPLQDDSEPDSMSGAGSRRAFGSEMPPSHRIDIQFRSSDPFGSSTTAVVSAQGQFIERSLESPRGYAGQQLTKAGLSKELLNEAAGFLRGDGARILTALGEVDASLENLEVATSMPAPYWPYGAAPGEIAAMLPDYEGSSDGSRPGSPGSDGAPQSAASLAGAATDFDATGEPTVMQDVGPFKIAPDLEEIEGFDKLPPLLRIYATSLVGDADELTEHGRWLTGMKRPILLLNPLVAVDLEKGTRFSGGGTARFAELQQLLEGGMPEGFGEGAGLYGPSDTEGRRRRRAGSGFENTSSGVLSADHFTGGLFSLCVSRGSRGIPRIPADVMHTLARWEIYNAGLSIGEPGDEYSSSDDDTQAAMGMHYLIDAGRSLSDWSKAAKLRGFDLMYHFQCSRDVVTVALKDVETSERISVNRLTQKKMEQMSDVADDIVAPLNATEEELDIKKFRLNVPSKFDKHDIYHRIKVAWQIRFLVEKRLIDEEAGLTMLADNIGARSPGDRLCAEDRDERISGLKSLLKQ